MSNNKEKEDNRKEAILINKMYTGSYLSNSNTGHETINFLKADDGSKYIYITPYGDYNNRDYKIKYVLLTGPQINKQYQIIAMVEVEDNDKYQDNDYSYHNLLIKLKGEKKNLKDNLISYNKKLKIHERQAQNLKYGGQYLYDIFKDNKGNDTAIYATFKVNNIYIPKEDIIVRLNDDEKGIYIKGKKKFSINLTLGQRGIKYIEDNDYKNFKKYLELSKLSKLWDSPYNTPKAVSTEDSSNNNDNFSFINLIHGENNEYAYSSMLAYYFALESNGRLLFQEFFNDKFPDNNIEFINVFQEHYLPNRSRPDIVFEGKNENGQVIIENKIKSGINGKQLTKYKKGLIFVPNYNENLIKNNPEFINNNSNFKIITYRELLDFFEDSKISNYLEKKPNAKKYFEDFKSALRIQSRDKGEIEINKFNLLLSKTKKNNYQVYVLKIPTNSKKFKYKYFVGVSNYFSAHEEEIKKFLNSKNPKQVNNISPNMEELKNIKYLRNAFKLKEYIDGRIKSNNKIDLDKNDLQKLLDKTYMQALKEQSISSSENKD